MVTLRRITGWGALVCYLVMSAMLYFSVLPSVDWLWPPDFHLRGYDAVSMAEFWHALTAEARETYTEILLRWDRAFILCIALWMALSGWRGGWMRYAVALLAGLYALIDLAENLAIFRFISGSVWDPTFVEIGSNLTMAKFASAYLCILVLVVHLRRLS